METLHLAISIADRYLNDLAAEDSYPPLVQLATISLLMAAKLEQPLQPSVDKMVKLVFEGQNGGKGWPLVGGSLSRQAYKTQISLLEVKIFFKRNFELQWAGPIPFAERYMKLILSQNKIRSRLGNNNISCS